MKRILAVLSICVLAAVAGAQTVTVDNTNGSPDNSTTFNSIMMALHSFQASGKVTASTDGSGVGVNHGNPAPNVIQVVGTGTTYSEIIRVDERATSSEQNVQDEDFTIIGIAGIEAKPVIAPQDDGTNDDDGFEIRTDVNYTIENCIFVWDGNFPHSALGAYLMTLDRLNPTVGTPSTVLIKDCVFTSEDASNKPIVTNKDEAFIDRRSELSASPQGRDLGIFPDLNEGMIATVKDCVFSHTTSWNTSRHASVFVFFGGTSTSWQEEAGAIIDGCVIAYNPGVGIEMQSGGNSLDATKQYVKVTGTNAKSGGIATGRPTVIAYQGNTNLPNNGTALFLFESENSTASTRAYTYDINNLWAIGCTGPAINTVIFGVGMNMYGDIDDCLFVGNNTLSSNTDTISLGWQNDPVGPINIPTTMNMTDTTIIANTAGASGTALHFVNYPGAKTFNLNNVIIGASIGAAGPITGIFNEGATVVNVNDSLIAGSGNNAVATATNNTGTGAINLTGVLTVDPQLVNNVPISDPTYFDALNQALVGARTGGFDLDGGRLIGPAPTSAKTWDMYL
ncbi:MAG: hypothetical protein Kow0059_06040 [Candidatus Sumerlaeia bacterium]